MILRRHQFSPPRWSMAVRETWLLAQAKLDTWLDSTGVPASNCGKLPSGVTRTTISRATGPTPHSKCTPGATGGVETPMALADGTVYVPVVNLATDFTASTFSLRKPATGAGELDAIDAATGTVLWKADLDSPDYGGATVAGDLVFTSTFAGDVQAFDRGSGKQVWSWRAPGGINGFISVAGDILLVPVGLASSPQLVALKIGAAATGAQPIAQPSALPTATTAPVTQ